ncbi:flagellar protein FliT [Amycolatopsis thermoflava]|uniref:flagellar protein FliT n=1 Tax=Amycolatopsis thermoflava TaxID=84480 RepID=UPI00040114F7|nr:flagellar protein FliT [Amycolatopsis thermoflava]
MTEGNGQAPMGPTVGAGLSAVGGAGYRFDPDQIAELIPKWEELRDGIDDDQEQLRAALRLATPPSADPPAANNAQQIRASIQAAIEHNASLRSYAQAWVDTLRKANGTYQAQDEETRRGLQGAPDTGDDRGLYQ